MQIIHFCHGGSFHPIHNVIKVHDIPRSIHLVRQRPGVHRKNLEGDSPSQWNLPLIIDNLPSSNGPPDINIKQMPRRILVCDIPWMELYHNSQLPHFIVHVIVHGSLWTQSTDITFLQCRNCNRGGKGSGSAMMEGYNEVYSF